MFYHLIIHTSDHNQPIYEVDIQDQESLVENIVIPYLNNETFYVDGYSLQQSRITRFAVKLSSYSIVSHIDSENQKRSYDGFYIPTTREHVLNDPSHVKDETYKFLQIAKQRINLDNKTDLTKQNDTLDKTKVFIVHGHDNLVKLEVERFLTKLNITPIILHEQPSEGKTIIEKIEKYSDVGFGVVLYTPCDHGSSVKETELKKGQDKMLYLNTDI